jgi:hypothetical protein
MPEHWAFLEQWATEEILNGKQQETCKILEQYLF